MSKHIKTVKLLPVWAAVSSALIVAGLILFLLLGFNVSPEYKQAKRVEVKYDTVVTIAENAEEDLRTICETAFDQKGVRYGEVRFYEETGGGVLEYTFADTVSKDDLNAAKETVESALAEKYPDADAFVTVHETKAESFYQADWRGAVALAVGCVVALVYLGVRFGVSSAATGLIACAHDVLLSLALFAILRIPVYADTPLLIGGIAAVLSLIFWTVVCAKMRSNFRTPDYFGLSVSEAVEQSLGTSVAPVLGAALVPALAFVVFGALATPGVRLFFLPALIPVAVCIYSSLVLAPAVHALMRKTVGPVKKNKRYEGAKAKSESVTEA